MVYIRECPSCHRRYRDVDRSNRRIWRVVRGVDRRGKPYTHKSPRCPHCNRVLKIVEFQWWVEPREEVK